PMARCPRSPHRPAPNGRHRHARILRSSTRVARRTKQRKQRQRGLVSQGANDQSQEPLQASSAEVPFLDQCLSESICGSKVYGINETYSRIYPKLIGEDLWNSHSQTSSSSYGAQFARSPK